MKPGRRNWIKTAGVFLVCFLLLFALSFTWFFPTRVVKRWVNSLNAAGKITVTSVGIDPLMRLKLRKVTWKPTLNPVIRSVAFDKILLRPSWSKVLRGERVLILFGVAGGRRMPGLLQWNGNLVRISMTVKHGIPFPLPFRFRKGLSLQGSWTLKANLSINREVRRGDISGTFFYTAKGIRIHWMDSPLGPLNLTFMRGVIEGSVEHSVFMIRRLDFRGNEIMVEGDVAIWIDSMTRKARVKGTLYLQPLMGLSRTNPRLNAAIQLLKRSPKGYKLVF